MKKKLIWIAVIIVVLAVAGIRGIKPDNKKPGDDSENRFTMVDENDGNTAESRTQTRADVMATEKETEQKTKKVTEKETETKAASRKGISKEFKEAMDSYEAFYDEYCKFMKEYNKNPLDYTFQSRYIEMINKSIEMNEKFEAWDEEKMSDEELKYYIDVNSRIQKKLIDLT